MVYFKGGHDQDMVVITKDRQILPQYLIQGASLKNTKQHKYNGYNGDLWTIEYRGLQYMN